MRYNPSRHNLDVCVESAHVTLEEHSPKTRRKNTSTSLDRLGPKFLAASLC